MYVCTIVSFSLVSLTFSVGSPCSTMGLYSPPTGPSPSLRNRDLMRQQYFITACVKCVEVQSLISQCNNASKGLVLNINTG